VSISTRKFLFFRWIVTNGYSFGSPWAAWLVGLNAIAAVAVSIFCAPGAVGVLGAGLALLMLAIAVNDWNHFIIPDALTGMSLGLALVRAVLQEPNGIWISVGSAVLRAAVLALIFLLLRLTYRQIRGREGIGLGDIKLAAVAGAWLDWPMMLVAVQIAACTALLIYPIRQYALGLPIRAKSRLPFGLFFAPAIWISWVLETILWAPVSMGSP